MNENLLIKDLMDFIDRSKNAYFATENLKNSLLDNGFIELKKDESWDLMFDEKYFIQITILLF